MPDPDPIAQFAEWLAEAAAAGIDQPEAMALATASADGSPSARMVLLRGADQRGFRFHTNRESRKGDQLAANPHAALLSYWAELGRQVRIEGSVSQLPDAESDDYFAGRPRESQLGAWASEQSRTLPSRPALLQQLDEARRRFDGRDVPRPPHWGGYLLAPRTIEFWRHGDHRLHERRLYGRDAGGAWSSRLLAP